MVDNKKNVIKEQKASNNVNSIEGMNPLDDLSGMIPTTDEYSILLRFETIIRT